MRHDGSWRDFRQIAVSTHKTYDGHYGFANIAAETGSPGAVDYLPPEAVLIRRMHGLMAVVLSQLHAGADWGAIAAEYLHGAPPSTPLGEAEAAFLAGRR